ncbi:MAG: aldehyde ferredoxin oxidoreductase N-terminal domain-containing protein [Sphaerochaetaceae bacterium]
MTTSHGNGRKYLVIDLAVEKWEVRQIPYDQYLEYPGGEALALYLWSLYAENLASIVPLSEANPLCFAAGALTGAKVVCSTSLSVATKSPATGLVAVESSRSFIGLSLKRTGWDAIVLLNSARRPTVIKIGTLNVEFTTSERLNGLTCTQTIESLQPTSEERIMCIGPAGENLVPFATICSDDGLSLGRSGIGAVMGAKRIKAIVVSLGDYEILPVDFEAMNDADSTLRARLAKSPYIRSLQEAGSLDLVERAMKSGYAAVNNFANRTDPRLLHLGTQECVRKYSLEGIGCDECPFDCRKRLVLGDGKSLTLAGFEQAIALGSNIGNYDISLASAWNTLSLNVGLDPVSVGNVLGWAIEAQERKIIDWAPMLAWGKTDSIATVIEQTAIRKGIGAQLSLGVRQLSSQFGLKEASCHIDGLEMAPYDVRGAWGTAVLMAIAEPFPLIPEVLLPNVRKNAIRTKAKWIVFQRELMMAVRTLGLCPHAAVAAVFEYGRHGYLKYRPVARTLYSLPSLGVRYAEPRILERMYLGITGKACPTEGLLKIGRNASALLQSMNSVMRTSLSPTSIPLRFLVDPKTNHKERVTLPWKELRTAYTRCAISSKRKIR